MNKNFFYNLTEEISNEILAKNFKRNLNDIILKNDVRICDLAAYIDVSERTIRRWLKGDNLNHFFSIYLLEKALGKTIFEMFTNNELK